MAENKTSFVLYSDSKTIIDMLSNEQAGLLLKTLFAYVNDENPIIDNSIGLVFEMIKLQLKRDLKKWERTKEGRSAAGKASAEARRLAKEKEQTSTNPTNVDFVQQTSTNPTVSDSVNVSVSVSENVSVNDIILKPKNNNFVIYNELVSSEMWLQNVTMQNTNKFNLIQVKLKLTEFNEFLELSFTVKNNKSEYCSHFIRWLNLQDNKSKPKIKFDSPA